MTQPITSQATGSIHTAKSASGQQIGPMTGQRSRNLRRQAAQAFLDSLNQLGETFKQAEATGERNLDDLSQDF